VVSHAVGAANDHCCGALDRLATITAATAGVIIATAVAIVVVVIIVVPVARVLGAAVLLVVIVVVIQIFQQRTRRRLRQGPGRASVLCDTRSGYGCGHTHWRVGLPQTGHLDRRDGVDVMHFGVNRDPRLSRSACL
jgi:hypothetical protein